MINSYLTLIREATEVVLPDEDPLIFNLSCVSNADAAALYATLGGITGITCDVISDTEFSVMFSAKFKNAPPQHAVQQVHAALETLVNEAMSHIRRDVQAAGANMPQHWLADNGLSPEQNIAVMARGMKRLVQEVRFDKATQTLAIMTRKETDHIPLSVFSGKLHDAIVEPISGGVRITFQDGALAGGANDYNSQFLAAATQFQKNG